eukprot:2224619-Prymnesium_polylepis.1
MPTGGATALRATHTQATRATHVARGAARADQRSLGPCADCTAHATSATRADAAICADRADPRAARANRAICARRAGPRAAGADRADQY